MIGRRAGSLSNFARLPPVSDPHVGKFRQEAGDRVVELEAALLVEHHHRHRGQRLRHRVDARDGVGGERRVAGDVGPAVGAEERGPAAARHASPTGRRALPSSTRRRIQPSIRSRRSGQSPRARGSLAISPCITPAPSLAASPCRPDLAYRRGRAAQTPACASTQTRSEPPRVSRRLFGLDQAAKACTSVWA